MKLNELLNRAVKPRLHDRFGEVRLLISEFDDESDLDEQQQSEIASISGLGLVLQYENAKGEKSQRIVTCKQFTIEAGKEYLKAFCHHRQGHRTFRLDRVADIFDPTTGESLSPVQAFFAQFAPDKMSKSGLSWGLSVARRADLIAFLNALIFLARCDEDYHPAERETLEMALTSFWLRLEIAGDPDFADILSYADRLSPDGETFWAAMHRFREDLLLADLFRRHARVLVEADEVVRKEEAYWLIEIDEFLSEQ